MKEGTKYPEMVLIWKSTEPEQHTVEFTLKDAVFIPDVMDNCSRPPSEGEVLVVRFEGTLVGRKVL